MTPLSSIAERAGRASPGEWTILHEFAVMAEGRSVAACGGYSDNFSGEKVRKQNLANTDFIAHAREDIPYLLSLIKAKDEALREIADEKNGWVLGSRLCARVDRHSSRKMARSSRRCFHGTKPDER